MKSFLLSVLSSNSGRVVTWGAAIVAGLITGQLARFGLDVGAEGTATLTATCASIFGAALDGWTNAQTARGVEAIQRALQASDGRVAVDAWAGEVTIDAVRKLVAEQARLQALVSKLDALSSAP